MIGHGKWWSVPVLVAAATFAAAQPLAERSVELDGETLRFSIRGFAPDALLSVTAAPSTPASALQTAKTLNEFLSAGNLEDAALLSNAPRRRFEVLRDYKRSVGEEGFKRVFAEYFHPENRLVAEVLMGRHSLLVWYLRETDYYAGQYYVEIEGKVLMDDAPGEIRSKLRRVLEGIRLGKISLPAL